METTIGAFEDMDFNGKDAESVYIDEVSVTYCQPADCTENQDEVQTLTVSSRNNGIARFINLKTENWSVSNVKELEEVINDFCIRASIKKDE